MDRALTASYIYTQASIERVKQITGSEGELILGKG